MAKDYGGISGTPWHVSSLKMNEDDTRRHRSRCVYYKQKTKECAFFFGKCRGSTHCDAYREVLKSSELEDDASQNGGQKPKKKSSVEQFLEEEKKKYLTGCSVHHIFYGNGRIEKRKGDTIRVAFENGKTLSFSLETCVRKQSLRVLPDNSKTKSAPVQKKVIETKEEQESIIRLGQEYSLCAVRPNDNDVLKKCKTCFYIQSRTESMMLCSSEIAEREGFVVKGKCKGFWISGENKYRLLRKMIEIQSRLIERRIEYYSFSSLEGEYCFVSAVNWPECERILRKLREKIEPETVEVHHEENLQKSTTQEQVANSKVEHQEDGSMIIPVQFSTGEIRRMYVVPYTPSLKKYLVSDCIEGDLITKRADGIITRRIPVSVNNEEDTIYILEDFYSINIDHIQNAHALMLKM